MKKLLLIALLCAAVLLSACGGKTAAPAETGSEENAQTRIELSGDSASISGGGAKVSGSTVTIASGGEYRVSGSLNDGQLIVDTGDDAMDVRLVLDNAEIRCSTGAALYEKQAKNLYLSTEKGTINRLISGTEADLASYDGLRDGAALFSEDDLKLDGEGTLEIFGYLNNGITCKDDLDIKGGTLQVLAAGNGVRGSESVEIKGGETRITSGNDGLKSSSADKEGKGFVNVKGGTLQITAQGDGISAETVLTVSGGSVTVEAQGAGLEQSSKALKAKTGLLISGGTLELRAVEDAISCDGDIAVSGGEISLFTENDGLQAGEKKSGAGDITVSGGTLTISAERRALNARGSLKLSGGTVLGFIGTEKQAEPAEGSFLLISFLGAAGDRLSLNGAELAGEAQCAYVTVFYTDASLAAGESYELSNLLRTVTVTAK